MGLQPRLFDERVCEVGPGVFLRVVGRQLEIVGLVPALALRCSFGCSHCLLVRGFLPLFLEENGHLQQLAASLPILLRPFGIDETGKNLLPLITLHLSLGPVGQQEVL